MNLHIRPYNYINMHVLFLFLSAVRCSPTMRFYTVSNSIQGRSQVHVFFCTILSHIFHLCLCLSSSAPFSIHVTLMLLLGVFHPHHRHHMPKPCQTTFGPIHEKAKHKHAYKLSKGHIYLPAYQSPFT